MIAWLQEEHHWSQPPLLPSHFVFSANIVSAVTNCLLALTDPVTHLSFQIIHNIFLNLQLLSRLAHCLNSLLILLLGFDFLFLF